MKRFPPRPAACVTAAPARKAGKVLEREDGSALCAERSMIVTSMQLTISSRRDIAVLRKESSSREGEEDVNISSCIPTQWSRNPHPRINERSINYNKHNTPAVAYPGGSSDIKHYVPHYRALLDPIMGARRLAQRQPQTN